ncbi:MAG: hypothetical protein ACK5MI_03350 [Mangrovibacterium sp.]
MNKNITKGLLFLAICLICSTQTMALSWPQKIKTKQAEITIYQPQTESLDGISISGRAAISIKQNSKSPIFGALWIDATLVTDRNSRTATLTNISIPNIKFSDEVSAESLEKLKTIVEKTIPDWNWQIPTDQLITTYENDVDNHSDNYKNDPPEIVLSEVPAMLISIDGAPEVQAIDGMSNLAQVVNTPFCVIQDTKKGDYYILGEGHWYQSNKIDGNYQVVNNPSGNLKNIQAQVEAAAKKEDMEVESSDETLQIIVRTHPAELLQTDGEANLSPINGTNLLYVTNSDNYIFLDIDSQHYYVNLSGRWYKSASLNEKWTYVNNSDLPSTFANIPTGSENDAILANVPGTSASRDAILDNAIPQTAEVSRTNTKLDVEYDGTPIYKNVDGTSMQYVENSAQTVIKDGNQYYCVDNGIWFVSNNPDGPWEVATVRPQAVDNISPSSPVYNVKYVYIYDVTPDVVYVGYTPGYYGSYVYNHTVIYGTGYYYRPWYGHRYYPRPLTYGFNMAYSPWSGWSIGWGFSYGGWFNLGWGGGHNYGGYWGVPAYRPPYARPRPPHGYYGSHSRPSYYAPRRSQNVYGSHRSGVRTHTINRSASVNHRGRNDVYTDRNGTVYRNKGNNWQKRTDSGWNKVSNNNRGTGNNRTDNSGSSVNRPNRGNSTGSSRENNKTTRPVNKPASKVTPTTRPGNVGSSTNSRPTQTRPSRPTTGSNRGNIGNTREVNRGNSSTIKNTHNSNRTSNMSNLRQAAQNRQRSTVRTTNFNRAVNTRTNNSSRSAAPTRSTKAPGGRGR